MHSLLSKLLGKRGITKVDELSHEEKKTYEDWQAVLSKEQLTTEDIKQFIQTQIDVIEAKWRDLEMDYTKKADLIPYHTCYKMLLGAINSPLVAREALEKNLQQLLNQ